MKTLFGFLLLVTINVSAQTIPSTTLQAADWAWLIGKNLQAITADSASNVAFREIRTQIRAANPASWTTNVAITNLPEWVAMAFYRTVKLSNAGEIASRYTAITGQFESKAQLTDKIAAFNERIAGDFARYRDLGKYVVMDQ